MLAPLLASCAVNWDLKDVETVPGLLVRVNPTEASFWLMLGHAPSGRHYSGDEALFGGHMRPSVVLRQPINELIDGSEELSPVER